jgi:hypothetical protein
MQAPSCDIRYILEAKDDSSGSFDLIFGTNLFIGKEPTTPKNCVTIYDTPGFAPYLGVDGSTGYEYPSIQIRVRNTSYVSGWNMINDIKNHLHGLHQELWGNNDDTLYSVIYCSSDPALLDWDDNGNARFVCNFNIQRRSV